MSELQSALHDRFRSGTTYGAEPTAIAIRTMRPAALVQIQAWHDTEHETAREIAAATGIQPPSIGSFSRHGHMHIMTIAPGRWLVLAMQAGNEKLQSAVTPQLGAVTDLGHARTLLQVQGAPVSRMLNKYLPLDLALSAFAVGRVAQSMIHHVDVTVLRESESSFLLMSYRSLTHSLFETLCDASLEYGYRLEDA